MNARQCLGKTKAGGRCPNPANTNSNFCYSHDPARVAERARARARGGAATKIKHFGKAESVPNAIRSLADVLALLDYVKDETMGMDNSLKRSRTLIALAAEYRATLAVGELENRIAALEAALAAGRAMGVER